MTNSVLSSIASRRAKRAISDQPIEKSVLDQVLQAAHLAPSCANNQPWRFVVVNEDPALDQLKQHLTDGNYWAKISPAIIAVASRADRDCQLPDGRDYYLFGCGLASMNLMLQATELGLIAHPIAGYRQAPIKAVLNIPNDYTLITLIILGYPTTDLSLLSEKHQSEENAPRLRKPLTAVIAWDSFSSLDPPGDS